MTGFKRFTSRVGLGKLACLLMAATLFTCEKVPDSCGDGVTYDPKFQFCFNSGAHNLCGGKEYNPLTEGCNKNAVGTKCSDERVVPTGTPCGGYNLNLAAAPATGGNVQRSSDGPYPVGEQVTLVAESADGYEFAGWAGAVTDANPAVTVTMDSNKPLIAMFKPTTRTLATTSFPPDGGTINRVENGAQVTVTAAPKDGHTFANWEGASTSTESTVTVTVDEGKTLVAMFTPDKYTLTVNTSPTMSGTVFVNGTATPGETHHDAGEGVKVLARAVDGYKFIGWSGASTSTTAEVTIAMNSSRTLTANFLQRDNNDTSATYTLTVHANPVGSGSVSRSPNRITYDTGTVVTVVATAAEGYTFKNWTGGQVTNANSAATTITMSADIVLFANFQQQGTASGLCTLVVIRNPAAGGAVIPVSGLSYRVGTPIDIEATPTGNYTFMNWTVTSGGTIATQTSMKTTVTLTANAAVTANFQQLGTGADTYTLTAVAEPTAGGTVSRSPTNSLEQPNGVYVAEREVTVTATASKGYRFAGWSGTALTGNPIIVTMSSNINLIANFEELTAGVAIVPGSFFDMRDGKEYRTVRINDLTWMAENLNYATDSSWCYQGEPSNCELYGRLYSFNAAMSACPVGWRLSTSQEWDKLIQTAGGGVAGWMLKSTSGFGSNGGNKFGFSALPGGYRNNEGNFSGIGSQGSWWIDRERRGDGVEFLCRMESSGSSSDGVGKYQANPTIGYSARCVKDD